MKTLGSAILLSCLASALLAAPPARISAAQLSAELQASGAAHVLHRYYDTPAWSASVIPGIRSATPAWLALAEALHAVADGGASEDLGLALYRALSVAPLRVLPVLSRRYGGGAEQLCNVSFEAEVPPQGVGPYLQSIQTKLGAAKGDSERMLAAACSRGLALSRAAAAAQGLE